jgi:hypothetical protein
VSTVSQIINTVEAMDASNDLTVDAVISLILVEKWRHFPDENLFVDELTNEDRAIVRAWTRLNLEDYSHKHQIVKDMVELFPGLSKLGILTLLDSHEFRQHWIPTMNYPPLADWERELLEY